MISLDLLIPNFKRMRKKQELYSLIELYKSDWFAKKAEKTLMEIASVDIIIKLYPHLQNCGWYDYRISALIRKMADKLKDELLRYLEFHYDADDVGILLNILQISGIKTNESNIVKILSAPIFTDSWIYVSAIRFLNYMTVKIPAEPLIKLLQRKDLNQYAWEAAITALGECKDNLAVEPILRFNLDFILSFPEFNNFIYQASLNALAKISTPEATNASNDIIQEFQQKRSLYYESQSTSSQTLIDDDQSNQTYDQNNGEEPIPVGTCEYTQEPYYGSTDPRYW